MPPRAMRRPLVPLFVLLLVLAVASAQELRGADATAAAAESTSAPDASAALPLETVSDATAFSHREVLGLALAGLAVFVAAGGGTGGGGILDPIYILIMQLDAKTAIPLSSITIVGGAVANLLINVRRARKHSTQPLIDWDFILVMQPMLLGAFVLVCGWVGRLLLRCGLSLTNLQSARASARSSTDSRRRGCSACCW